MHVKNHKIKIIITGATGFVGEGVLRECIDNPIVDNILIINRKASGITNAKVSECLLPDFNDLNTISSQLIGYDACFYCAGISSAGLSEDQYTQIAYDTTLNFAHSLANLNAALVFNFVSGRRTDSTETGKIMWARIKGRTENALGKLDFKAQFNFRPGAMIPFPEQKNVKWFYRIAVSPIRWFAPSSVVSLQEVGRAMINATINGYPKSVLEVADIKKLASQS